MTAQQQHRVRLGRPWSYTEFVRTNPGGARALESILQYVGFFAPASWGDRDLAIETGYAAASLAALANGRILRGARSAQRRRDPQLWGTLEEGDEQAHRAAPSEERLQVVLAVLAHVQIVAEKTAHQVGGEQGRRTVITCVEALKAVCRLLLLASTQDMLLGGGVHTIVRRKAWAGITNLSLEPQGQHRGSACAAGAGEGGGHVSSPPSLLPPPLPPAMYTGKRSGLRMAVPAAVTTWNRGGYAPSCRGHGGDSQAVSMVWQGDGNGWPCSRRACGAAGGQDRVGPWNDPGEASGKSDRIHSSEGGGAGGLRQGAGGTGQGHLEEDRGCRLRPHGQGDVGRNSGAHGAGGVEVGAGPSRAWLLMGEVVHILRPVVYSHFCSHFGERSWNPWLISLGMDTLAYACTSRAGSGRFALLLPLPAVGRQWQGPLAAVGDHRAQSSGWSSGGDSQGNVPVLPYLNAEQQAELRRRKLQWLLYLMRSPAFDLLASPVAHGVAGVFEGVPLFGGAASYALNMLVYVQRHHFYMSAS